MILFPAVDIKGGQCVRLRQGLEHEVTVFSKDPVAMARHWAEQGARWLHVVDLDGAFQGSPVNEPLIRDICATIDIPVQLGGGVRDQAIAGAYLDAGVERLIIGTLALEDPQGFRALCAAFPDRIGVSLDGVDGVLKSRGWVSDTGLSVEEVLPRLEADGAAFVVYTDISRDGMQSGVNVAVYERLVEQTRLPVLAAGGVATLEDVKALLPLSHKGLEGVITGKAIYEATLDFSHAQAWLDAIG